MPETVDISIYQGDSFTVTLHFWSDAAHTSPLDVSGRVYRSQIRPRPGHATLLAEFSVDMTDASDGTVLLSLTPAQTALLRRDCAWDVEQQVDTIVLTIVAGDVDVTRDVTEVSA